MKRHLKKTQIEEFETRDLGHDVRKSKSATLVVPKQKPTSILLPQTLIKKLKKKAEQRGIGYQTMLKIILNEQVDHY